MRRLGVSNLYQEDTLAGHLTSDGRFCREMAWLQAAADGDERRKPRPWGSGRSQYHRQALLDQVLRTI